MAELAPKATQFLERVGMAHGVEVKNRCLALINENGFAQAPFSELGVLNNALRDVHRDADQDSIRLDARPFNSSPRG